MTTVAVVIPFFQRQGGILTRCLNSIRAQRLPQGTLLHVIVVDDGSPLPAVTEVADLPSRPDMRVTVLKQANAGPAAARNRAIDAVPPHTRFVAFIDSDDIWEPEHVAQAIGALDGDGDFYFCDSEVEGGRYEFERLPVIADAVLQGRFQAVAGCRDVFSIDSRDAPALFVRHYIAHTSTVVYRFSAMPGLRFREDLRYGSEDHLMWVQAVSQARRVCFSRRALSRRGKGVNLYRDALDRISAKNIRREICRAQAFSVMAGLPGASAPTIVAARQKRDETLLEIAGILSRLSGLRAAWHPDAWPFTRRLLRRHGLRTLVLAASAIANRSRPSRVR